MNDNPHIEAARTGRNSFWYYLLTVFLVIFLVILGGVCVTLPIMLASGSPTLDRIPGYATLALNLVIFAFVLPGLWIGLRLLHRRPFMSLVNPTFRFNWKRFWLGGGLWLALNIGYQLVLAVVKPGYYAWTFNPAAFWPYLLVALLLIPIQSGAEELVFRGYLTQGFGLLRWWLGWLVPGVLFGLLHIANPEINAYGLALTMPIYIGLGVMLGWITLRSGSLELALGVHIINNLYSTMIVTFPSSALQTEALFTIRQYDALAEMIAFVIIAVLFVAIIEQVLRGKTGISSRAGALLLALALIVPLAAAACTPAQSTEAVDAGALALEPCQLEVSGSRSGIDAECGTLTVPENRSDSDGRAIDLNVVVLRAVSRNAEPDPVFLLAGGPGEAASETFALFAGALERVRFKRDLVMVDQRGTGSSAALDCQTPEETPTPGDPLETPTAIGVELPLEDQLAEFETCLADFEEADLTQYTTDIAMQDLDEVRAALGYEQVNLLGVSYGTRAALVYARLFPARVRSMVLDGVVPPGWALGSSMRADAQRAFDLLLARCEADADCAEKFPELEADFYDLLARLEQQQVETDTPNPLTGEKLRVAITPLTLTTTVRLMTYNDTQVALLPLMIHNAYAGDYGLLASNYLLLLGSLGDSLSLGMYYSVWCYEDLPHLSEEGELGMYYFDPDVGLSRAVCDLLPQPGEETPAAGLTPTVLAEVTPTPGGEEIVADASATPADADAGTPTEEGAATPTVGIDVERSFPRTDIPVLLISGDADPVTPPANGEQVAEIFTNNLHVVLPGMAHSNFYVGCMPTVVRDFIETAGVADLDTGCTQTIRPLPFFLSPVGPKP